MIAGKLALYLRPRVNNWFLRTAGGERRPVFFDIDSAYPSLRRVDKAYPGIRREALSLLEQRQSMPRYHETDGSQTCISAATPHDWRVFYLYLMGQRADPNLAVCPATAAVLDDIPGLMSAYFSVLDAGKSVPPHHGPFGGYLRYHLGLVVPANNPPTLRVRDTFHTWREGESVLFDDSHEHEVINESDGPRVVLIVDVERPMPLPQRLANRLATRIARRTYGQPVVRTALDYAKT